MTTTSMQTTTDLWTLMSPEGDTIEIDVDTLAAAKAAAVIWVGDYAEPSPKTTWEVVTITSPGGGICYRLRVEVEPEEPWCAEDEPEHRWVDGPVYGSGGGVCYRQTCRHCGQVRRVDTWATDPCDGSQGHTSVEYLPAD
jgi:hypothetical protein